MSTNWDRIGSRNTSYVQSNGKHDFVVGDYTELKLLVSGIIEAYVQANINQIYRTWQVNNVQNNTKNIFLS